MACIFCKMPYVFFRTTAARQNTFIVSFENYAKTELSIIYNVYVVVWRRVNRGWIYRKGTKKFAEGLESAQIIKFAGANGHALLSARR